MMRITSELIERCKRDDMSAQVQLYELCYPRLMPVCQRYMKNEEEAREMLNIGFYRVLKGIRDYTYKSADVFHHWARRVVINAIIDEFRKSRRYRTTIITTGDESTNGQMVADVVNTGELKLDAEHLYQMINELPEMQRKVFTLYVIDDFSHKEIAGMLRIREGTSRWYLSEARKEMRRKIEVHYQTQISIRS
jgi:RNA polymerase sigma factor (sigma-70 family)